MAKHRTSNTPIKPGNISQLSKLGTTHRPTHNGKRFRKIQQLTFQRNQIMMVNKLAKESLNAYAH